MKINFDFMKYRRIWYLISLVVLAAGIVSLALPSRGLNEGIDFTGGSLIDLQFEDEPDLAEVRAVLDDFGLGNSNIVTTEKKGFVSITTKEFASEGEKEQVYRALTDRVGAFEELQSQDVSAVVSRELTRNALIALLIASAGILAYVSFRFEVRFGVAAIVALLHDALVTLGFFSLLQVEVNVPFVAAILTIVGYSINDTIVVFDRIRDNLKIMRKESPEVVANVSINQTLVRSLNTSLTTLAAVLALLLLGGRSLQPFSLALFIGIVSGTYSSIFVASALWVDWKRRAARVRLAR